MEFKGTKGKWHNNGSEVRHSDRGIIIANVYAHNENNMPFNERIANAKLIACAPELLELLMDLENDDNRIPKAIWDRRNELIHRITS